MSDLGVLQLRAACRAGCRFLERFEQALRDRRRAGLTRAEAEDAARRYAEAKAYLRLLLADERALREVERNVRARLPA